MRPLDSSWQGVGPRRQRRLADGELAVHYQPVVRLADRSVVAVEALVRCNPERLVRGTDWPHPNIARYMPNDGDLVDLIPLQMPDPAMQQLVLVDNPHRLYQFTG